MAEKTYTVKATNAAGEPLQTRVGQVTNRKVVEDALQEGRIIPPVVEYAGPGDEIKLDAKQADRLAGLIEEKKPSGSSGPSKEELEAEAVNRGLTVAGTGADGNVTKADLEKAIADDDASKSGS